MAVVQISRIQVRRGKINSGTGLPQLASGELAWSIDSQELWIGNGAVSEGAPAVGNTKIITQNDLSFNNNLLNLVQHLYKANDTTIQTGADSNIPVLRPLQDWFDDHVNAKDFGSVIDGVTDDTAALQRAVNQLFLNPATKASVNTPAGYTNRRVLKLPAGKYITTKPIFLPSYTTIVGAGTDKTLIYYNPVSTITATTTYLNKKVTTSVDTTLMIGATITGPGIPIKGQNNVTEDTTIVSVASGEFMLSAYTTSASTGGSFTITLAKPAFQTVNDASGIGSPSPLSATDSASQTRGITIKDLSITTPTGKNAGIQLDAVRDSLFENLHFIGTWGGVVNNLSAGISLNALSSLITCENNIFRNIKLESFTSGVLAKQDILNNLFEDCLVKDTYQGFNLGTDADGNTVGQQFGPRETTILNTKFVNIKRQAVYIALGSGNTTNNCRYYNVGCNGGSNALYAAYPQVYFGTFGNTSINDRSDRVDDLSTVNTTTIYKPEISGHGSYTLHGWKQLNLGYQISPILAFRLPVNTDGLGTPTGSISHTIDYIYNSTTNSFTRAGVMTISGNMTTGKIQLSDEYNFTGADPDGSKQMLLDFTAYFTDASGALLQYNGGGHIIGGAVPSSIVVYYVNNYSADTGSFSYRRSTSL
jgi:hypothetical protein